MPSQLAILDALHRFGPRTPEQLAGMLSVSGGELNAELYEVARRAWVVTLAPGGSEDPKTVPHLSLTSDGEDALRDMRATSKS